MLKESVANCRTVGIILTLAGAAVIFLDGFRNPVMNLAATAVLIGPGVWYCIAARMIHRRETWVVRVCLIVVFAQFAAMLGSWLVMFFPRAGAAATPACVCVFFVPALLALLHELRKARGALEMLGTVRRGFEPLDVQPVEPLDKDDLTKS